ncbi:histidine kinase [Tsukamurella sp. 8F]|uniref:sensor histidine kinase n=1 Tax=unclassified Tsukamurella TaxID=2633480 RepID=UPI0023B9B224|nr:MULTISPECIES: histidine kinase [unclassified Tsukamurella]MDF0530768.1 histidine kinase [Tsukamurella sp. 8J]MDF0587969.1 histidine kinase [Tsukamurella sp. 8F]
MVNDWRWVPAWPLNGWRILAVLLLCAVVATSMAGSPLAGSVAVASLACLFGAPGSRSGSSGPELSAGFLALLAAIAGTVSMAVTLFVVTAGPSPGVVQETRWTPFDIGFLMLLLFITLRAIADTRPGQLAGGLIVIAVPVTTFRFYDTRSFSWASVAFWAAAAAGGAVIGALLCIIDLRRRETSDARQRGHRLEVARDLHDFVAHDVSEVVAQSQAGQILAGSDERLAAVFRRIEDAGQRALASLDRTVAMMHRDAADNPDLLASPHTLDDIRDVVTRFDDSSPADTRITIEAMPMVSRDVADTAYRIVVESLTNIRRHAPKTPYVDITIRYVGTGDLAQPRGLELAVTNQISERGDARLRRPNGGHGLPSLAQRVEALDGTLTFGPTAGQQWRLAATLPLRHG